MRPPEAAKTYATLLVCLRGSLCLYQGEELGLPEAELMVPWRHAGLAGEIHASTLVLSEEHGDEGTTWRVRAPASVIARLRELAEA